MKGLKVVLPVAGSGTRLRPLTLTIPKVLLRVAGKPILAHIIEKIINLPLNEVIFIVGHLGEQIEEYVKDNFRFRTRFIYQKEQLGLGHAIYLTKDFVEPDDDLLILLGDTIFETNLSEVVKSEKSLIAVKEMENPSRFGVVQLDGAKVVGFVEKPEKFVSNLAIVGIYFIKGSDIFLQGLEKNIKNDIKTKGEFQLTDGLQSLVGKGIEIGIFPVEGWCDCGKPETLLTTNQYLLKKYHRKKEIGGSLIIPPVLIEKDTIIKSSIVGPYVSVAEGCKIIDSIVKNSILNTNASIRTSILVDSIIGESAIVKDGLKSQKGGNFCQIDQNLMKAQ